MINKIKNFISLNNLDGYVVPKNDEYFTEYSNESNLKNLANFTGSAGFALILKKKNYLFVDGRYTIQAKKQSGKKFIIYEIPYTWPKNLFDKLNQNLKIGFNPKLFTSNTLLRYFGNTCDLIPIYIDIFKKKKNKIIKENYFFTLDKKVTGKSSNSKIYDVIKLLKKQKIDHLFISSGENVCWLLNIRGKDLPNSPVANCQLILSSSGVIHFFSNKKKVKKIKKKIKKNKIIFHEKGKLFDVLSLIKNGTFCVDNQTCSVFNENLIRSKFKIIKKEDPIYNLKSIKNNIEINNMIKAHIEDGVALTKFIYWIKNIKSFNIDELIVEKKLEKLRKKNKNYLYPSFSTIAGSGPNGAIIHYKSNKQTNRKINKKDLLLVDSGGQYKWGTTDVTRTITFDKQKNKIKKLYTRVLKGHIAVALSDIKYEINGHNIDKKARKSLNLIGLDYGHGTGHGVGFFLNVHEGPQSISKNNFFKLKEGMIVSNEPGYYLENKFGIRIENLVFIKKSKNKLYFKNLTLAPLEKDLIDQKMLTKKEKDYLFKYHLETYSKLSPFLKENEKKWLARLI